MTYVLYNPLADNRNGKANADEIKNILTMDNLKYIDITTIDIVDFFANASERDRIVIAGGDGTIHFMVNAFGGKLPSHPIFYYPVGSGNDFKRDLDNKSLEALIPLNPYIENLPIVKVNGIQKHFLNGVGFGIDGYCCEEGDLLRQKSPDPINYTSLAIKGMLFKFKPRTATITVDGVTHTYKNAWIASTMNGRYYGGGMMVAPNQDRLNKDGTVSTVVMYHPNKLKTLMVFASIFKGNHVKHKEMVEVFTGHEITVTFDVPTPLQIDGETISGVESYSVSAKASNCIELKPTEEVNS